VIDLYKFSENIMSMDEEAWERHSNPKSVYSRYLILPLFSLAVYSRIWIGWYSAFLVLFIVLLAWYNPRAFSKPENSDNWASRATYGERIYLRRRELEIPTHHRRAVSLLAFATSVGLPVLFYGLYSFNVWYIFFSNFTIIFFKTWLLDRMNWIYADMKSTSEEFSGWLGY